MNGLIDFLNEACDERVAITEHAARDAQQALGQVKETFASAKQREHEERRAIASARQRLYAQKAKLEELARQTREAIFSAVPQAEELIEQHVNETDCLALLQQAITRHEAYDLRDAMHNSLEAEKDAAAAELLYVELEHDALLYRLLNETKKLAVLNGSTLEISESQFANGRVLELRNQIEKLHRRVDDLSRQVSVHDHGPTN